MWTICSCATAKTNAVWPHLRPVCSTFKCPRYAQSAPAGLLWRLMLHDMPSQSLHTKAWCIVMYVMPMRRICRAAT